MRIHKKDLHNVEVNEEVNSWILVLRSRSPDSPGSLAVSASLLDNGVFEQEAEDRDRKWLELHDISLLLCFSLIPARRGRNEVLCRPKITPLSGHGMDNDILGYNVDFAHNSLTW